MKLGLISDVHGDPLALKLACGHLRVLGAEKIVCAGDVVGYGPYPDQVVEFLAKAKIEAVRGNHDRWAVERGPGEVCAFGGGTPGAATIEHLKTVPENRVVDLESRIGVIVHGSPKSDMEYLTPRSHPASVLRGYLEDLDAELLVYGHTHSPRWYRCDRGLVINPGSLVSMPVVRSSRSFALVDTSDLSARFFNVETGRPIDVPPWPEDGELI
jgi:putative phosphoesterase